MPFSSIYEFLFPYWYFALRNKRYSLGLVTVSLKRKKDFKWDFKPLNFFFKYETVEKQSNFKKKALRENTEKIIILIHSSCWRLT